MAFDSHECGKRAISIITVPLLILFLQVIIYLPEGNAIAQEPLKVISQTNKKIAEELLRKIASGDSTVTVGDMILNVKQLHEIRLFGGFKTNIWPNGKVYYEFESGLTQAQENSFQSATMWWSNGVPELQFIRRTTEPDYVFVRDSNVNSSAVGMSGGVQIINILNWNIIGTIAHEVGHTLGMVHEHQRTDRGLFVDILWQNIRQNDFNNCYTCQFALELDSFNYTNYDFESIMHYPPDAFSVNGANTIEPLPAYSTYLGKMGQRDSLSYLDIQDMKIAYSRNWHPDGTLVQVSNDPKVYMLENRGKRWIVDAQIFDSYRFDWNKIITISPSELNIYWDPDNYSGYSHYDTPNQVQLFKEPGNSTVWLQQFGNVLRPIKSQEVYESWGFSTLDSNGDGIWDEVQEVPDVTAYGTKVENDPLLLRDGTLVQVGSQKYVIEHGQARPIESNNVFYLLGYEDQYLIPLPSVSRLEDLVWAGIGQIITEATVRNAGVVAYFPSPPPDVNLVPIGSFLQGGTQIPLNWSVNDDDIILSVDLFSTYDGWTSQQKLNATSLLTGSSSGLGAFPWNVPSVESSEASIRLTAYDSNGNLSYDFTSTFSISGTGNPPGVPNLTDPGLWSPTGNFVLNWSDATNATTYTLWEDDNDSFSSPTEYSGIPQSEKSFTGKANGFYYYKVKAVNTSGESAWSNTIDFEVRVNGAPYAASNPTPANGATGVSLQPTFTWQSDDPNGDNVTYDFLWGTTANSQGEIGFDLTTPSFPLNFQLNPSTTYYWKIRSEDVQRLKTMGPLWSFTTAYIFPDLAIQSSIIDNASPEIGSQVHVTTSVQNVGNDDATITQVNYYFSTQAGAQETLLLTDDIPALTIGQQVQLDHDLTIPQVAIGVNYIDVVINLSNSPVTEDVRNNNVFSHQINVSDTQPPVIDVFLPPFSDFNTYRTGQDVDIAWTFSDNFGIDYYDIFYSIDDGVNWIIIELGYVTPSNFYAWTILQSAITTTARVKVTAYDLAGLSNTDIGDLFEIVDGTGPTVQVLSPNGGESWDLGSTHDITWSASSPNQIIDFSVRTIIDGNINHLGVVPGNQFSYSWTLPAVGGSDQALIKIIAEDEYSTKSEDVSDNYFTISDPFGPPSPPWQTPVAISQVPNLNLQFLTQENNYPASAIGSDGSFHVAYIYYQSDNRDGLPGATYIEQQVFYRKNVGGVWQSPVQVSNYLTDVCTNQCPTGTHTIRDVKIDLDGNGNAHLTWKRAESLDFPSRNDDVIYSYDNGTSWSSPVNLSQSVTADPNSFTVGPDLVVASNGDVHVIWRESVYQVGSTVYHTIKSGGSWSTPQPAGLPPHIFIDLATDVSGNVHMLTSGSGPYLYHNIYNGSSWNPDTLSIELSSNFNKCNLRNGIGNNLHAFWSRNMQDPQTGQFIVHREYALWNGSNWSAPEEIVAHPDNGTSQAISLAVNSSDEPFFFWIEVPDVYTLYSKQKTAMGFSPVFRISDRITLAYQSVEAASFGDNLHVIWQGNSGGNVEIISNTAQVSQDLVLPVVSIASPIANEAVPYVGLKTLNWLATDNVGVISVDLEYSVDDGANFAPLALGEQNDGVYDWSVPAVFSDSAIISIIAYDAQGNEGIGFSPRFRISDLTPPSVVLISPNGGESFEAATTASINWNVTDNVGVDSVALSYSTNNGATFLTISNNEPNDGQADWTVPSISTSTALIQVVAQDSAGHVSADTSDATFSITLQNNSPYAPYAPVPSDQAVGASTDPTLSWQAGDPEGDPLLFDVYLNTSPTNLQQVSSGQDSLNIAVENLANETTYYWQVVAADGFSQTVGPVWSFTTAAGTLFAPTNLTANALSANEVQLTWNDNSDDETGFKIEAKVAATFDSVDVAAADTTTFAVANLTPNTDYVVRLQAIRGNESSDYSNEAQVTTGNTIPATPTSPVPADGAGDQAIDLTLGWTSGDPDAGDVVKYYVYFGTSTNPELADSTEDVLSYAAGPLAYSRFYFWKIVARDGQGATATGPIWSFSTGPEPTPVTPTDLTAEPLSFYQVALDWQDGSENELGFKIERKKIDDLSFSQVGVVFANDTTSVDSLTVQGETTYLYRTRAYNGSGNSLYSNVDTVTTPETLFSRVYQLSSAGWHLVSWNVDPPDDSTHQVFKNILSNVDVIQSFDNGALTYDPQLPEQSSLKVTGFNRGYWVRLRQPDALQVVGAFVDPQTPVPLLQNWNLVSYLPSFADSVDNALGSILDKVIVVLGFEQGGLTYSPDWPDLSSLQIMKPGLGYWIKTSQSVNLVYPSNPSPASSTSIDKVAPSLFTNFDQLMLTNEWMTLFSDKLTLDGDVVEPGMIVKVVDGDGIVRGGGTVTVDGRLAFLPVYRAAPLTQDIDEGISGTEDEVLRILIDDVLVKQTLTWQGLGALVQLPDLYTDPSAVIPGDFVLYQNYPNPFNPSTTLRFDIPSASEVKIRVFNLLGQEVKTLVDKGFAPGQYEVVWKGTNEQNVSVASGVYLILMKAGDFRSVKKMLLLR